MRPGDKLCDGGVVERDIESNLQSACLQSVLTVHFLPVELKDGLAVGESSCHWWEQVLLAPAANGSQG